MCSQAACWKSRFLQSAIDRCDASDSVKWHDGYRPRWTKYKQHKEVNYFPPMVSSKPCFGFRFPLYSTWYYKAGMSGLTLKQLRLAPNGSNPGVFQIRFQYILDGWVKMYRNPEFVQFWANLTHFGPKSNIPDFS